MPNPGSKPKPSPRPPRHLEASERLERNRERVEKRRARARQREKAITAAVKQYVAAWVAIDECESKRDRDLETYRQQMQQLKTGAEEELAGYRGEQAAAAAALREEGQSDDDVAELLEITPRQARQLIAAARNANHESGPSGSPGQATPEIKSLSRTSADPSAESSSDIEPTQGQSGSH
ncbi:hypothetical protein ACQPW1_30105 [Nocardia sp. CA-128927]|uniref:hypothetical protein n=1 Tax=Nocardia sp. CA-128927 TaxID=3239975 RepID=UPI003D96F191